MYHQSVTVSKLARLAEMLTGPNTRLISAASRQISYTRLFEVPYMSGRRVVITALIVSDTLMHSTSGQTMPLQVLVSLQSPPFFSFPTRTMCLSLALSFSNTMYLTHRRSHRPGQHWWSWDCSHSSWSVLHNAWRVFASPSTFEGGGDLLL